MSRVIPFGRILRSGARGKDVQAIKRGLAHAGHGKLTWAVRSGPIMGVFAVRHLKAFQKKSNLSVTGVYNAGTHQRLAKHFDDYAFYLYTGAKPGPKETPEERKRRLIVAAALLGHAKRAAIHYTQTARRMQGVREKIRPPAVPSYEDCSSFATWLYWTAGANDPNGLGYNGMGYTGTLCRQGRAVPLAGAKPGDLVFYGSGPPWGHVAIYVGGGKVVSHGSEGGPYLIPVNYRPVGQVRNYFS